MTSGRLVSLAGLVLIAAALLLAVALISLLPGWRLDLTEDRLFTLAPATRDIVSNLEAPIELTFFYSDSATEDVPQIRTYATRVRELLGEIVIASNGRLSLRMIDPEPFSEDEDLANQFGVQAVPVTQGGEADLFRSGGGPTTPRRRAGILARVRNHAADPPRPGALSGI